MEYIKVVLIYLFTAGEVKNRQLFIETIETGLSPKTQEAVMTIAEQFKAEGVEKGRLSGLQEGISEGQAQAKKS